MITAHKKNRATKKISAQRRQDIALKSLDKSASVLSRDKAWLLSYSLLYNHGTSQKSDYKIDNK